MNFTNISFVNQTIGFNQIGVYYSFIFVIGLLFSIVGVVGNMMIMISILASNELRTNPTCILCFNIALSDFLMSIFVNGFGKLGKKIFFKPLKNYTITKLMVNFYCYIFLS
jgi:hypothetical protein